ncbi:hypothetical protein OG204_28390 [Streptomyces sp. NBC_01387]|uniref:hypothetical protein n=1 Tax=unclassified Streptomyces TaxID=2593676 RepID=UPI002023DD2B|nr:MULTISPECIES: hypothetical protein [unclassified Streptomyces]MCX4547739.1 hypothetical protein [Streptomyces sp. NBC_01500]WSC24524.1 hypothetical protein OIE60_06845 [Streptomyces sp. NBC_01766]WSV58504.1 hypothetical protein OG282_06815 [Streptomyces sp. NBC_01014]
MHFSPLIPEESQIHESAQGPRSAPAAGRTASTPRPVPGPRPAAVPRPARPGPRPAARPAPSAPPVQRTSSSLPTQARSDNRPAARPETPSGDSSTPQLQLIPATADGSLDAAEEAVDLLLDAGRLPGDVLLLTTGEQHPWAAHELSFGEAAYWAQHDAREDVFYADAAAVGRAKARPVVVVALNGGSDESVARVLPVARERAEALLIVCGDPQRVNAVLGAGV